MPSVLSLAVLAACGSSDEPVAPSPSVTAQVPAEPTPTPSADAPPITAGAGSFLVEVALDPDAVVPANPADLGTVSRATAHVFLVIDPAGGVELLAEGPADDYSYAAGWDGESVLLFREDKPAFSFYATGATASWDPLAGTVGTWTDGMPAPSIIDLTAGPGGTAVSAYFGGESTELWRTPGLAHLPADLGGDTAPSCWGIVTAAAIDPSGSRVACTGYGPDGPDQTTLSILDLGSGETTVLDTVDIPLGELSVVGWLDDNSPLWWGAAPEGVATSIVGDLDTGTWEYTTVPEAWRVLVYPAIKTFASVTGSSVTFTPIVAGDAVTAQCPAGEPREAGDPLLIAGDHALVLCVDGASAIASIVLVDVEHGTAQPVALPAPWSQAQIVGVFAFPEPAA